MGTLSVLSIQPLYWQGRILAWQATVNHKMRFMSVTHSFLGSANDKTICKFDKLTQDIRFADLFANNTFNLYTADGLIETQEGLYLICDGGFVQWRCLMTGYKFYSSLDEALWSAQMESTRKDVAI